MSVENDDKPTTAGPDLAAYLRATGDFVNECMQARRKEFPEGYAQDVEVLKRGGELVLQTSVTPGEHLGTQVVLVEPGAEPRQARTLYKSGPAGEMEVVLH